MSLRVRKKKNSSGSTSIHIVDRTDRGYKVVESIGCSYDENEIETLYPAFPKHLTIFPL